MNIAEIEKNLEKLVRNLSNEEFIFDLLLAYGTPRSTVNLLKKGRHNLSKQDGQIILKKKLFFQEVDGHDLHETIDNLSNDVSTMRHSPRFIIVTDYSILLAVDTKTREQLDIEIKSFAKHCDFFLPWAGMEKHSHTSENPADRKAAEKMAKLYDGILADNNISDEKKTHDLNVFLARLLFCFFAEDTNIFENKLFTNSVDSHTKNDGSDFGSYLDTIFTVLNSEEEKRSNYPQYLRKFPYVNGGLFAKRHWIPKFTARSRKITIECGELDWSKINPDIFGSMIQAVVHPGERKSLGMHYTSVPNIMKVIEPLFLNDLKDEFDRNKGNTNKLQELLNRLSRIKLFDPACGSGNFLIITYKELRRLEMAIIKDLETFAFPNISLSQFYGIEIDDFAHEIAKLSLYLAEHQMNVEFQQEFGKVSPTLPLKTGGHIICANATRMNWVDVCRKKVGDEIYIMGNPPYLGSRNQDKNQKEDMHSVFKKDYKSLDYIACWFALGAKYIEGTNATLAFVSTNSISQGEQVSLLWPLILKGKLEIFFAHRSFKWSNNAKKNAGVTVVIIGIQNISKGIKKIFKDTIYSKVENINPYLTAGKNIIVYSRSEPLSNFPEMNFGNMPADGGYLLFSEEEKNNFIKKDSNSQHWFKKLISADEFLNGNDRWCLWLKGIKNSELEKMPLVKERIDQTREVRKKSSRPQLAQIPHLFAQITQPENKDFILIPRHSSENRVYIPMGFFNAENISHDSCLIIADAKPYLFGVLTSKMHMTWVRAVAGQLETRIRYSKDVAYNTFPIRNLTTKQKENIDSHVYNILAEREKHSEKTMAEMYDSNKMPEGLREAHNQLDLAVERCYRSKPFTNDEERLEYLFKLYEQMIAEEKGKQSNK